MYIEIRIVVQLLEYYIYILTIFVLYCITLMVIFTYITWFQ